MNEPKLRFPEFTGAWEQRKLGDIVPITMGQSPNGNTYSDTPSDFILVQGNADLQNGWVTPRMWTTQVTKKADAGDLIMSVRAPAGAMGKTAYDAVIGRGVAAIKGNEFIYQLLVKMDSDGYWKPLSCGSTFESLNSNDIKNANVLIPNTDEQTKIGTCFANLDNLIQSAEKELEGYRELKQGMLQKMFPKKGDKVPEIRFPEFTGDWEEHELSEMFNYEQPSKYIVKNDDYEGCSKYPVLTANKGFILGYTDETEGIYDKGEVIIFDDFTCDHKFVNFPFKVKSSAIKFLTPKDNYNLSFLSELLSVMNQQPLSHQRHWISVMQPSIALIPSLEEQKKIGEYFSNLDDLITLQQKELDGYKELKKGLLQQMFC